MDIKRGPKLTTDDSHKRVPDIENLSFERAVARLNEAVRALETGGLSLEDAIRMYEDGMRLARACGEMLASAELRITRVRTAYGEQMRMSSDGDDADGGGTVC